MNYQELALPLKKFVDEAITLLEVEKDEQVFLPKVGTLMKELISTDTWLDPIYRQEHSKYYRQYPLYIDLKGRLSIVSFVWGPGQRTPVHDHTIWGVIGMLQGSELDKRFKVDPLDNSLTLLAETQLLLGDVGYVSTSYGDIHQVSNAYKDQVSISIHAYGGNIGEVDRHVFPADGQPRKDFKSGYSEPPR